MLRMWAIENRRPFKAFAALSMSWFSQVVTCSRSVFTTAGQFDTALVSLGEPVPGVVVVGLPKCSELVW